MTPQPEDFSGLCTRWYRQSLIAIDRRHGNGCAQCSLRHVDRNIYQDVVIAPTEELVRFDLDYYLKVPRWAAIFAWLAQPDLPNPHSIVHAAGYFDRYLPRPPHLALAAARPARCINHFATAITTWAGAGRDHAA